MNTSMKGPEKCLLSQPRAIVFDWDNTLVDTWPNIIHTMNVTLAAMGHAVWTNEDARQRIARSLRDSFPDLFGDRWKDAREIFYAELERSHIAMLTPLPGVADVLGLFSDLPMAVVSNKTGEYLRKEVAHLGWSRHFQAIFGAGDLVHDKPAPDAVLSFLNRVGLAPGPDIWFVGDSPVDVETAHAAGCTSVFVQNGTEQAFHPDLFPHVTIGDCRALPVLAGRLDETVQKN
ncbi:MAG: HAD-IA family hydrolase [Rhodospirillaceae bacterium]|nr:HAD-IA family hydrolase [Rhodospirillaceae bacterium]